MIRSDVYVWGSGEEALIGSNRSSRSYRLPRFCSLRAVVCEIVCGKDHLGFIDQDGLLYSLGSNAFGKLGVGISAGGDIGSPTRVVGVSGVTHVSCGNNHSLCCTQDGELFAWGDNSCG